MKLNIFMLWPIVFFNGCSNKDNDKDKETSVQSEDQGERSTDNPDQADEAPDLAGEFTSLQAMFGERFHLFWPDKGRHIIYYRPKVTGIIFVPAGIELSFQQGTTGDQQAPLELKGAFDLRGYNGDVESLKSYLDDTHLQASELSYIKYVTSFSGKAEITTAADYEGEPANHQGIAFSANIRPPDDISFLQKLTQGESLDEFIKGSITLTPDPVLGITETLSIQFSINCFSIEDYQEGMDLSVKTSAAFVDKGECQTLYPQPEPNKIHGQ